MIFSRTSNRSNHLEIAPSEAKAGRGQIDFQGHNAHIHQMFPAKGSYLCWRSWLAVAMTRSWNRSRLVIRRSSGRRDAFRSREFLVREKPGRRKSRVTLGNGTDSFLQVRLGRKNEDLRSSGIRKYLASNGHSRWPCLENDPKPPHNLSLPEGAAILP